MSDPDTGVPRTVGPLASAGRFKVKAAASVATPNPQPGQMEARVTHAKLRFADGSGVEIDFSQGRSIDDALSALRMASTGDTRPTPDGEIGELVDGDNFPKVRHWFFQALSPEDRQGFLEAWYGLPRSVTSATSINLQHQMLKHAYRPPALETQAADIARLREALEPFAKIAELREDYNDRPGMLACVPIETCVAARAALATNEMDRP